VSSVVEKDFARAYTLGELFHEENFSFSVPIYQREYAWQEVQTEDLISDFFEFAANRDSNDNYLLGQVIVSPLESGPKEFSLVDGQQRFTTLLLLFSAARDFANDHFQQSSPTKTKDLADACGKILFSTNRSGKTNPRLEVASGGQVAFKNLIHEEKFTPNSTDKSAQNVKNNYEFFLSKFQETFAKKPEEFFSFMEALQNNVILIVIKLSSDDQALDFFERTNDRGLPLNQSDLMKNLLFSKVSTAEYKGISDRWATAVNRLRAVEITRLKSMDFALKALLSENSGESFPRKQVFRQWRDRLKTDLSAEKFLADINEVTEHISRISVENSSDPVSSATSGSRYLNAVQQWTVTSAARNKPLATQAALAEIVEARTILSTVIRERSQDFERVISPWSKCVASLNDSSVDDVRSEVLEASRKGKALLNIEDNLAQVHSGLSSLSYANTSDRRRIRLLLAIANREMALELGHDSEELPMSYVLGTTFDIEHIEPRSRMGTSKYSEENISALDSIGNLTLWYRKDNRKVKDADPVDKLSLYSQSSVLLTRSLCPVSTLSGSASDDKKWKKIGVTEKTALDAWGVASIHKRETELANWLLRYFRRVLIN
jgi:hypothetical protein